VSTPTADPRAPQPSPGQDDLAFAGGARQAELLREREIAAPELVELYLERIERIDPRLNAFRVVLGEEALAEAERAQARLDAGETAPLLGVPVAIKDEFDVAGQVNTVGCATVEQPAQEDAEVVRRLRAAGAIPIGITKVPELTIWPFTESKTWGKTRNPWDPARTPGGSSGGSAAAVAAGLAAAALGSDGGGSIRIPAAWCGLLGLKVQRGRISYMPLREHWHGMSVPGPIARRVLDAALFLDAVAGSVQGDAASAPAPAEPFAAAAQRAPGRLRIAMSLKVPPGVTARVSAQSRRAIHETAELLRSLGHDVRERDPDYGLAWTHVTRRFLRGIHDDAHAMPNPERLERRTREMARMGGLVPARTVAHSVAREPQVAARVTSLFNEFDVLMTPVTARPAPAVGRWEGRGAVRTLNGITWHCPFTAMWNLTGQPAAAVPAGFDEAGMPMSVQLIGRFNDEATLLSLAAQIEAERPWAGILPPVS
jgi:amidase